MKKIILGAIVCAGLFISGVAVAKVSPLIDQEWTSLNSKGGEVHRVYDKDTATYCYTYSNYASVGISCLKK